MASRSLSPSTADLVTENAELRARLEEAEELLAAIRRGDVDALVVESHSGPRVFTLQGTEAESNRFRGEIIAQVSDAVVVTDLGHHITYFNAAAERQYGVTASDALGRRVDQIFQSRWLQPGDAAAMNTALTERSEWRGESVHVLRDGRQLAVESSITTLLDRAGVAIGRLAVIRDVTERKHTEEALRRSEERYRALVEVSPQVVWMADAKGECTFLSQHWFDYTGQSVVDSAGSGLLQAVDPDHRARVSAEWARATAAGDLSSIEFPLWRASDREYRWHLSRGMPLRGAHGQVVQWIGAAVDIHDLKQAERTLRDADRLKDEFLATLAHELRNPLAPVRNAVQIMRLQSPAIPSLQWAGDVIDRQVKNLTRLIDDLMDVSRINLGRIELRREHVALAKILRGAVETSRPFIEECGHELTVALPDEPIFIDADVTRLAQVYWNLLNNAAKYMTRGGRIELTARREGNEAVVCVRDHGIGISADKLPGLFVMFSQIEAALSRSQGGLGIGLYVVKRLVDMHGGSVTVHSDGPGHGSNFCVRLPTVAGLVAGSSDQPQGVGGAATNLHILVVDDNVDSAATAATLLEIMGNRVEVANDGEAAVRAAANFRPDVVLLDIGMPKLNGYEVARRIRRFDWGDDVALIAMTGWGQESDIKRSAAAGFDHHLVKPVDPDALANLLRAIAAGRVDRTVAR